MADSNQQEEAVELNVEVTTASASSRMDKHEHLRHNLFKCHEYALSIQDKRRDELLEKQKLERNKICDNNRGITAFFESNDGVKILHDDTELKNWRTFVKKKKYSQEKMMYSEWFTQIPNDLETEWLVKLCPIGVRNLVVAHDFKTRAYKNNKVVSKFVSNLPSGREYASERNKITILDCIYNHSLRTFFVLDVLFWKDLDLCKSPATLRFFWLKSRLNEIPVQQELSTNKFRFIEVPEFPADLNLLQEKMAQPFRYNDTIVPLDGVLFYHKETWYKSGLTPLVGWLKPYMIPEKLHIPVCEHFMVAKPDSYVCLEEYLSNRYKKDVVMKDVSEKRKAKKDNVEKMMT